MKKLVGSVLLLISIVLISFSSLVYNLSFWEYLQDKHDVNESIAKPLNNHLLNYFENNNYESGPEYQGLTDKEKLHMLDVKKRINIVIFLAIMMSIGTILFLSRMKKEEIEKIFILSGVIIVMIPLLFFIIPFEPLFSHFHEIFFAEGSYLFSSGDLLIQAYPEEFFRDFVVGMIGIMLSMTLLFFTTGFLVKKFK